MIDVVLAVQWFGPLVIGVASYFWGRRVGDTRARFWQEGYDSFTGNPPSAEGFDQKIDIVCNACGLVIEIECTICGPVD